MTLTLDERRYVPILKAKQGEYRALQSLPSDVRASITPMVELLLPPWDADTEQFTKTLDAHLTKVAAELGKAWGLGRRIWIDALFLDADERPGGKTPIERFCELARADLWVVPVGGLARGDDYGAGLREAVRAGGHGAVLRLESADFDDDELLPGQIAAWLNATDLEADQVDLILDLAAVTENTAPGLRMAAPAMIAAIPDLVKWRSFTLAGGAFPESLAFIGKNQIERIPRLDWDLWTRVSKKNLPRRPAFADYAIAGTEPPDPRLDPRKITMSAAIRYCSDTMWLVAKRGPLPPYEQFRDASRVIRAEDEWAGEGHCAGCEFIARCAAGEGTTGSQSTWRQVGTTHHVVHVVAQLANLP